MSRRVLVVEDHVETQDFVRKAFVRAGFDVAIADSAEKAFSLLDHDRVEVVFCDLQLPGMDGLEFCRRLRQRRPTDCIFAMTGHTSVFDLVRCREAGFDDYFPKPLNLPLLVKAANDAFERLERWKGR